MAQVTDRMDAETPQRSTALLLLPVRLLATPADLIRAGVCSMWERSLELVAPPPSQIWCVRLRGDALFR